MAYSPCLWIAAFQGCVRDMLGPCLDYVLPILATRTAGTLKFSRLSQHDLRLMPLECFFLELCQGHVWTILGPNLVQLNLQTS